MDYSIREISEIVKGNHAGAGEGRITNILIDSRRLYNPEKTMFVALSGPNHDGHNFIPDLISRGLGYFLVEKGYKPDSGDRQAVYIFVDDTTEALQKLAESYRAEFEGRVIGITGSNGKTVVKEWLSVLLSSSNTVSKSPKSYNSQIGVPLSVLSAEKESDYCVLEAGISLPGEMQNLERIIRPDIGFLTNITDAHQENFESYELKLNEKLKLFTSSESIYYSSTSELIEKSINQRFGAKGRKLYNWSFEAGSDLYISKVERRKNSTVLHGIYLGREQFLEIPFSDNASIENIALIWLFWLVNELDYSLLHSGVNELEPVAMRLEQKDGIGRCTIINDYYNADLQSLEIAMDLLINQLPQKKKSIIISDLLQSGKDTPDLVKSINRLLGDKNLFRVIGIGKMFHENSGLFNFPVESFPDTETFLKEFSFSQLQAEAILLKGARRFRFERISRRLEKRVNSTYVEVNMKNLGDNLNYFRSILKDGTRVMVMVKAASYGSGTHEIAKFLAMQRVDYLGVAIADEGVHLRDSGVEIPIMVMNPGNNNFEVLIENNLEPEIFSLSGLKQFSRAVKNSGIKRYPVHLKFDTGMHRLGFGIDEEDSLMDFISRDDSLKIKSVFSHLAYSDSSRGDEFTRKQGRRFEEIRKKLMPLVESDSLFHLANTSALIRFPEYHYDMVRLGIGIYGIDPTKTTNLKNVISFKSSISQVHNLKEGEPVGYGNSQIMTREGRIAVVPVGYADGFDRRLGNGVGSLIINGRRTNTIGSICMDMCMVDVTDLPCAVGDEVIVFDENLTIESIADLLSTIPYEILTGIPQRVKRIFYYE